MCCTGMAHCYEQHTHYWVTSFASWGGQDTKQSQDIKLTTLDVFRNASVCLVLEASEINLCIPGVAQLQTCLCISFPATMF